MNTAPVILSALKYPEITCVCHVGRITATCDVCGAVVDAIHMPEVTHGFYCAQHCPCRTYSPSEEERRAMERNRELVKKLQQQTGKPKPRRSGGPKPATVPGPACASRLRKPSQGWIVWARRSERYRSSIEPPYIRSPPLTPVYTWTYLTTPSNSMKLPLDGEKDENSITPALTIMMTCGPRQVAGYSGPMARPSTTTGTSVCSICDTPHRQICLYNPSVS